MRSGRLIIAVLIALGAGVILIPNLPLFKIILGSQVVNGMVLPFVLIFMLLLINKKELMGKYVNSTLMNVLAWTTTVVSIVLTLIYVVGLVRGAGS